MPIRRLVLRSRSRSRCAKKKGGSVDPPTLALLVVVFSYVPVVLRVPLVANALEQPVSTTLQRVTDVILEVDAKEHPVPAVTGEPLVELEGGGFAIADQLAGLPEEVPAEPHAEESA